MIDRLEEIKNRLHAWTHWQRAAGNSVEETHVPDMQWLIDQLAAVTAERERALDEVIAAVEEHAEGGNIENYRHLSDRLDALKDKP